MEVLLHRMMMERYDFVGTQNTVLGLAEISFLGCPTGCEAGERVFPCAVPTLHDVCDLFCNLFNIS